MVLLRDLPEVAKTRDLAQYTILAGILVVAAGQPNLIVPQTIRTGAVAIDIGINRLPDGCLIGDADFEGVRQKTSYIAPVPGGAGSMTPPVGMVAFPWLSRVWPSLTK